MSFFLKQIILLALAVSCIAKFPYFNQCNEEWKDIKIKGQVTFCDQGNFICSVAMMLAGDNIKLNGGEVNPKTMDQWLKANNGYNYKSGFVNYIRDKLGYIDIAPSGSNAVKSDMQKGYTCIAKILKNRNDVLVTAYDDSGFTVNDPATKSQQKLSNSEVMGGWCFKRTQSS